MEVVPSQEPGPFLVIDDYYQWLVSQPGHETDTHIFVCTKPIVQNPKKATFD